MKKKKLSAEAPAPADKAEKILKLKREIHLAELGGYRDTVNDLGKKLAALERK